MIQREYLSDEAIDRLRNKIQKRQQTERRTVPPVDQKQFRKRIADLDRKIDQGADRVFSAPDGIVDKLYAKLEGLRQERDQLKDQLTAVETPRNSAKQKDDQEVEAALQTLSELSTAIDDADPDELRELLAGIISKIELRFSHDTSGKRTKNTLEDGTIYVRPPVGSSLLFKSPGIRQQSRGRSHRRSR